MKRGLIIALAHASLLIAIAAYADNLSLRGPSVWTRAHLSITQPGGRYLRLDLEVQRVGFPPTRPMDPCRAEIQNGALACVHDPVDGNQRILWEFNPESRPSRVRAQHLVYVPAGVVKPGPQDELWGEVALSGRHSPIVIRLGFKRDGMLQPLW